ncbi:type I secretion system permease/ATPase [Thiomicrorhabdus sediminis]|uniref:Type I secretion system permease/ATPase n=1 Tax=Thiomicrorhabdus sediminis TaxID=2580412 RepID=A0A4V1HHZ4_9GAMM|nr:type I secretion system permease/ATPase [Thiomicrorhabdus sediminis]QCU90733.1 type I secretion system permease/ATPase [Thiomicrorhabdus sediminis]
MTEKIINDPLTECLLILCRFHDRNTTRDNLVSGLPLNNGQLSPSHFERAAKRADLASKFAKRKLTQINSSLMPAILILKDDDNAQSACVLLAVTDGNAQLIYPDLPDTVVEKPLYQLESDYSGQVIYVRPEFHFDSRATQFTQNTMHWFWGVIKENHGLYRDILIASIFINLFAIAMPLFVMNVYDRVVPNHTTETLWMLAIGIGLVMCAELALRLARNWFIDLGANRADIKISAELLEHVMGLKLKNRPISSGSFVSNIQSFESIRNFIGSLTVVALVDLPFVLLFATIVALINIYLVIPILLGALFLLVYAMLAQRKMHSLSLDAMQAGSMRNATLYDGIANLETIKSLNIESKTQTDWEKTNLFLTHNAAKMRLIAASITQGAHWTQQIVGVSVIIIGVYLIIEGQISQGALIASYMLSVRAMSPISQTAGLLSQYHYAATAYDSLDNLMALETERATDKDWISPNFVRGEIEFKNVNFRYSEEDEYVLKDVSFKIQPGESIALLGRNGSGKSTIEKLILGLYEPESGSVMVDGINLKHFDPAVLRRHIGYMPQENTLFFGTLKENITITNPFVSDEQILKVTKFCGLNSLLQTHSAGLELPVGEQGRLLSGGQKQAVALARALVGEPPILLFDEPTGSFDYACRKDFVQRVPEIAKGKTLLMITHNINLIQKASRVMVMDSGKVIADGPTETVLEALRQGRVGSLKV